MNFNQIKTKIENYGAWESTIMLFVKASLIVKSFIYTKKYVTGKGKIIFRTKDINSSFASTK